MAATSASMKKDDNTLPTSLEQKPPQDDEACPQIVELEQRIQVYQNYLSALAKYRQPGAATSKTAFVDRKGVHGVDIPVSLHRQRFVDRKWVHGVDIPVSLHRQRIVDKLAIVFDPITLSFASLNRDLLYDPDYKEVYLPCFSLPFDTITIHANIESDTKSKKKSEKSAGKTPSQSKGRQYVATSRGERKARETGGSFEHIVTFPLAALGWTILLQRLVRRIKKLHVLTANPSVYESPRDGLQDQSLVGKERPKSEKPTGAQHTEEEELYKAIYNNDTDRVTKLLQNKAIINKVSGRIGTPLQAAAYHGNKDIVQLLLNEPEIDVDGEGWNRQTALHLAAKRGHAEVVNQLLNKRANPSIADNFSQTPLWLATENGHFDVMKTLLDAKADPNIRDNNGRTPLWWAAGKGSEDGVKLLLECNAEPDPKDVNDETPLWWAVRNGHKEVVKLLLAKNADPDARNKDGRTPLSLAEYNRQEAILPILHDAKIKRPTGST